MRLRVEIRAYSAGNAQPMATVNADQQPLEGPDARNVTADHKLLLKVEAELLLAASGRQMSRKLLITRKNEYR